MLGDSNIMVLQRVISCDLIMVRPKGLSRSRGFVSIWQASGAGVDSFQSRRATGHSRNERRAESGVSDRVLGPMFGRLAKASDGP